MYLHENNNNILIIDVRNAVDVDSNRQMECAWNLQKLIYCGYVNMGEPQAPTTFMLQFCVQIIIYASHVSVWWQFFSLFWIRVISSDPGLFGFRSHTLTSHTIFQSHKIEFHFVYVSIKSIQFEYNDVFSHKWKCHRLVCLCVYDQRKRT